MTADIEPYAGLEETDGYIGQDKLTGPVEKGSVNSLSILSQCPTPTPDEAQGKGCIDDCLHRMRRKRKDMMRISRQ